MCASPAGWPWRSPASPAGWIRSVARTELSLDGVGLCDEHPANTAMVKMAATASALFIGAASSCSLGGAWQLIVAPRHFVCVKFAGSPQSGQCNLFILTSANQNGLTVVSLPINMPWPEPSLVNLIPSPVATTVQPWMW